jgi:hypothetical protein
MSLLGKILTVLNALAAIAFLSLAAMDYGKRQSWAYSVFRHELAIHGLPVDDQDDSWRAGTPIARDLTSKTLDDLFRTSGGRPVKTQREAVEAMKATVMTTIDGQENEAKKREAIGAFWLPLIPHLTQRNEKLDWINGPSKKPIDELKAELSKEFDAVIQEINQKGSTAAVRMKVADLLYNLNPLGDPALRDRAQAVVGLEQFTLAADRQASRLFDMATQMEQIIRDEQGTFVRQWQDILTQLAVLNEQMKADSARLDEQKKLLEQHNLILTARKAARDELIDQVRQANDKAAAENAQLMKLQQQLFDLQRDIAAARAKNESLEEQIRAQEVGQ